VEQAGTPQEVFDRPASPFVMDFLGHVNVFHGRVQGGRAHVGGVSVAYPEYPHEEARAAAVYVRPHELEVGPSPEGAGSLEARVLHTNPAGSVARVRLLVAGSGAVVQVDMPPERFAQLGLKAGDTVYVCPRKVRVFVPEEGSPAAYAI
jgi:sulfate transport system ATP-binding protein